MSGDALDGLGARLRGLEDAPVDAHPDALESVHKALVAELDALAGAGSLAGERRGR